MLEKFWFLLIAHFIGDWGLQNRWMAENKYKYWEILTAHCFIWTGCISIVLYYFNLFVWWKIFTLLIGHYVIDFISSNFYKRNNRRYILWIDHISHFLQLVILF